MAASSTTDEIRALAGPIAARAGLVVEDVTVTPAGRRRVLRVVMDLPETEVGGVPMAAVAAAAQALSAALDSSDVMGQTPYVLEVSSPGVDRPLTQRRHFLRARGRLVRLDLNDGGLAAGRLTAVDDDALVLDGDRRLGWARVVRGRVEVEFGRVDEEPAEASAADGDVEATGEAGG